MIGQRVGTLAEGEADPVAEDPTGGNPTGGNPTIGAEAHEATTAKDSSGDTKRSRDTRDMSTSYPVFASTFTPTERPGGQFC